MFVLPVFSLFDHMQHDYDQAEDEQEHCIHKYNHNHLLARLNKDIKLPSLRLLPVFPGHYEEHTFRDDWGPDTHAACAIHEVGHCEGFDKVVTSPNPYRGEG